jgi:N-methylhydantoinase A
VGPQSAGADGRPDLLPPRGGTQVTVTDAHVILGRIPPHLLGGEIPVDAAAARGGLPSWAAAPASMPSPARSACSRCRRGTRPMRFGG